MKQHFRAWKLVSSSWRIQNLMLKRSIAYLTNNVYQRKQFSYIWRNVENISLFTSWTDSLPLSTIGYFICHFLEYLKSVIRIQIKMTKLDELSKWNI